MIAPLRRRHRWIAPGAFALAAAGLALGVASRPTRFVEERRTLDAAPPVPAEVRERAVRVLDEPALSAAFGDALGPPLWLVADERLEAPDVLAYHTSETSWDGDLPADARLVGDVAPLGASPLDGPRSLAGRIVLYSLGHRRAIATIDLDALAREQG
ncbi:MAG: hypothetical protein AAGA20_22735 [Planctomycetota bacterium]